MDDNERPIIPMGRLRRTDRLERIGDPGVYWATRYESGWTVFGFMSGAVAIDVTRDEADRMIANFRAAAHQEG